MSQKKINHPEVSITTTDICRSAPSVQESQIDSHYHAVSPIDYDGDTVQYTFSDTSEWTVFTPAPNPQNVDSTLSFSNNNGFVGQVTWDEGGVKFEGAINDCAKMLFERVNEMVDYQLMQQSAKHQEELRAVESDRLIKLGNMQTTLDHIDQDHALKLEHVINLMQEKHKEELEAKVLRMIEEEATDAIQCAIAKKSVDAIRAFSDEELAHFRVNREKQTISATNLPTLF